MTTTTLREAATRWASVEARDLMRTNLVVVADSAPLSEVERVLAENRVGGVPVVDSAGHIVGVISMRDLIARYVEDPDARPRRDHGYFHMAWEDLSEEEFESFDLPEESEDTAEDIMTAEVYAIPASAGLREIATEMNRHGVHRLLVEEGGRRVGLISTRDILRVLSE